MALTIGKACYGDLAAARQIFVITFGDGLVVSPIYILMLLTCAASLTLLMRRGGCVNYL